MFLPRALSCVADAQSALLRLRQVFEAETSPVALDVDAGLAAAIDVTGRFAWDANTELDVDLRVKKGELVAIIGPVGCGKSSLLQAIIGEMPKVTGKVQLSSGIAYVQQSGECNVDTLMQLGFKMPRSVTMFYLGSGLMPSGTGKRYGMPV